MEQLNGRTMAPASGVMGALLADAALRDAKPETGSQGERPSVGSFEQMLGGSPVIERVRQRISRVAPTALSVLISGESGTGKALAARALHERSRCADGPFIALNCGALAPALLESALFGYEHAGSFHPGVFETASEGTLFLDDIVEMPLDLQPLLLRVLETRSFSRIGNNDRLIRTNARIIAATSVDPARAVAEGRLRSDLLYRLQVFPIELPPLRARSGDVTELAQGWLARLNRENEAAKCFDEEVLAALSSYDWPGNIRQLQNVINQGYLMAPGTRIELGHLPALPQRNSVGVDGAANSGHVGLHIAPGTSLAEVERQLIINTVQQWSKNKKEAARVLGISAKTLYNRLKAYECGGSAQ